MNTPKLVMHVKYEIKYMIPMYSIFKKMIIFIAILTKLNFFEMDQCFVIIWEFYQTTAHISRLSRNRVWSLNIQLIWLYASQKHILFQVKQSLCNRTIIKDAIPRDIPTADNWGMTTFIPTDSFSHRGTRYSQDRTAIIKYKIRNIKYIQRNDAVWCIRCIDFHW